MKKPKPLKFKLHGGGDAVVKINHQLLTKKVGDERKWLGTDGRTMSQKM